MSIHHLVNIGCSSCGYFRAQNFLEPDHRTFVPSPISELFIRGIMVLRACAAEVLGQRHQNIKEEDAELLTLKESIKDVQSECWPHCASFGCLFGLITLVR